MACVAGFFHSAQCFQGSSMLSHESILHSFIWLSNILFYGYINLCLLIGKYTFKIFHFFSYYKQYCSELSFSYSFNSLGYIPTNRIAKSHGNSMFNFLNKYQTVFQSKNIPFYIFPGMKTDFNFSIFLPKFIYYSQLKVASLWFSFVFH